MQAPWPSHPMTFTKPPRRPRNTNRCPPSGSCCSTASACAASVVNPLRMSATPAASQPRVSAGTGIKPSAPGSAAPAPRDHARCIIPAAHAHQMPAHKLDLDVFLGDRSCHWCLFLRDDLHRQKARPLRQTGRCRRVRPIPRIAPLFEDQVGIHGVEQRHLINRQTRCRRREADPPLLLIHPKPLRPTRHAITIVSIVDGGHYPELSAGGSAVSARLLLNHAPRRFHAVGCGFGH
jgi:hypothetical protein